jgi:hypothetical protein
MRFVNQQTPVQESQFMTEVQDIHTDASVDAWAVEIIIHTLYFVQSASWMWHLLEVPSSQAIGL